MKAKTLIGVLYAFLWLTAAAHAACAQTNEFELRGIYLFPSGAFSFSNTETPGTTISFDRDFDFPNRFGLDLGYAYRSASGKHKFKLGYTRSTFESTRTLTRSIEFLNQTFTANVVVTGQRKLQSFGGMYVYRWGNERLRIGPMADLGVIDASVDLRSTTSNIVGSERNITKFAALVGYDLDYFPTHRVNIFNNLGAIKYKHDRLFRVEGGGRLFAGEYFGISGGYQFVNYRLVDGVNFIRARQHGPFIGGVVRF
jgi:hypothetical protein